MRILLSPNGESHTQQEEVIIMPKTKSFYETDPIKIIYGLNLSIYRKLTFNVNFALHFMLLYVLFCINITTLMGIQNNLKWATTFDYIYLHLLCQCSNNNKT